MKARFLLVFLAWAAAVALMTPAIGDYYHVSMAELGQGDLSFYMRLLGEGRSLVSGMSVLQADRYYHGGVGHFTGEHAQGTALSEEACPSGEGSAGLDHDHEKHILKGEKEPGSSPWNFLMRISEAKDVTSHVHLQGKEEKEIIPWIYYAAEIDPQNVNAYLIGGYWLSDRLGRVDEGLAFLREGLQNNPGSWELNSEIGRILMQKRDDYLSASRYLARSYDLLEGTKHDKFDERQVITLLAFCLEKTGRKEKALELYSRLSGLFPEDELIREKLTQLSS